MVCAFIDFQEIYFLKSTNIQNRELTGIIRRSRGTLPQKDTAKHSCLSKARLCLGSAHTNLTFHQYGIYVAVILNEKRDSS
jgi:hypothetical protein